MTLVSYFILSFWGVLCKKSPFAGSGSRYVSLSAKRTNPHNSYPPPQFVPTGGFVSKRNFLHNRPLIPKPIFEFWRLRSFNLEISGKVGKVWGSVWAGAKPVSLEVAMRKDVSLACSFAVPVMAYYGFGVGAIFRLWMGLGGLEALTTAVFSMFARGASYEITGDGNEMVDLGPGSESLPWLK